MSHLNRGPRIVEELSAVGVLITFLAILPACHNGFWGSQVDSGSGPTKLNAPELEKPLCTRPLSISERGKVKFQPGHYVALGQNRDNGEMLQNALSEIRAPGMSAVKGVQIRYSWSELQGNSGPEDFNFSRLLKDMDVVEAAGKKLSVMIMWKFATASGASPVPDILGQYTAGSGIPYQFQLNAGGEYSEGFIANLGHPLVTQELTRFLGRLADVVDNRNVVTSIVFAESALGLKRENFSPPMSSEDFQKLQNAYIDGLLQIGQQSTCLFKHTPVIQFTNGPLPRLEELIINNYTQWSISLGGPDVWINDFGMEKVYAFYPRVESLIPIGMTIAGGNYLYSSHDAELLPSSERGPYLLSASSYNWTPNQTVIALANKAKTDLKPNYFFWRRVARDDPYYLAFREEIVKTGTPSQTIDPADSACPKNYGANCVLNLP